jgi:hypothetical protein
MINMLMADILSLYIPGALDELASFAGDTPIPQLMLGGAVIMEIAIVMIVLSHVLASPGESLGEYHRRCADDRICGGRRLDLSPLHLYRRR